MIYLTDDRARAPKGVIPAPIGHSVVRDLVSSHPYQANFIRSSAAASVSFALNQWMFGGEGITLQPGDILITCEILCHYEVPSDVLPEDIQYIAYKV